MGRFIAAMVCALLVGCASVGTHVSQEDLDSFAVGVTTAAQVNAKLGEPQDTYEDMDGNVHYTYEYEFRQVKAAAYVPIVNWFASGVKIEKRRARLVFDKDGILLHKSEIAEKKDDVKGLLAPKK